MSQKLVNGVPLSRIDAEQVGDQIFGGMRDVVPPRAEESVVSSGNFLSQDVDTLVVEGCTSAAILLKRESSRTGESTEQSIQDTTKSPHIDTFTIPLIFDNLRCGVSNSTTRRHGLLIPDDFTQTKVGNLDSTDSTTADSSFELSLVFLFLIIRSMDRCFRGDDWNPFKEQVFRLDISVDHSSLFVQVPYTLGNLKDDVSGEVFGKVGKFNNLMEQLATLHD